MERKNNSSRKRKHAKQPAHEEQEIEEQAGSPAKRKPEEQENAGSARKRKTEEHDNEEQAGSPAKRKPEEQGNEGQSGSAEKKPDQQKSKGEAGSSTNNNSGEQGNEGQAGTSRSWNSSEEQNVGQAGSSSKSTYEDQDEFEDDYEAIYTCYAWDAIKFRFVDDEEDVTDEATPEYEANFVQHAFKDNKIFGYKNLKITIMIDTTLLYSHVKVTYDAMLRAPYHPDDIITLLKPWIPTIQPNQDDFVRWMETIEHNTVYGVRKYRFEMRQFDDPFVVTVCTPHDPGFQQFHTTLENLTRWFVEKPNFVDMTNHNWHIFYCYIDHDGLNELVGYCSCYAMIVQWDVSAVRLSQIFTLPHYRCMGIGRRFQDCIGRFYRYSSEVVSFEPDVPCDTFKRMRLVNQVYAVMQDGDMSDEIREAKRRTVSINERLQNDFWIPSVDRNLVIDILQYYYAQLDEDTLTSFRNSLYRKKKQQLEEQAMKRRHFGLRLDRYAPPKPMEIWEEVDAYIENDLEPIARLVEASFKNLYEIEYFS